MNAIIEKGKPLVLRNGATVLPEPDSSGSKVLSTDDIEKNEQHEKIVKEIDALIQTPFSNNVSTTYKRTLADIDVDFNHMNVVMLVASYTLWGLDVFAISQLLRIDRDVVEQIRDTDLYTKTRDELVEALRYAEEATVHGYIQSKAQAAAQVIVTSLASKKEEHRISAAKDLLDRGGFRPADRVEHSVRFEDELRIRYVSDPKIPTIDLEINDGDGS